MKSKLIHTDPQTFIIVFDNGDKVMPGLQKFVETNKITSAQFTAIGAFSDALLGFFQFTKKDYKRIIVKEQTELLSLTGNISLYQDKPKIHAHAVLGRENGNTLGGHFLDGVVHPTLEVVLQELPVYLTRRMNENIGIPLIDLS